MIINKTIETLRLTESDLAGYFASCPPVKKVMNDSDNWDEVQVQYAVFSSPTSPVLVFKIKEVNPSDFQWCITSVLFPPERYVEDVSKKTPKPMPLNKKKIIKPS